MPGHLFQLFQPTWADIRPIWNDSNHYFHSIFHEWPLFFWCNEGTWSVEDLCLMSRLSCLLIFLLCFQIMLTSPHCPSLSWWPWTHNTNADAHGWSPCPSPVLWHLPHVFSNPSKVCLLHVSHETRLIHIILSSVLPCSFPHLYSWS